MADDDQLWLDDPRALRAMAHPARVTAVDELAIRGRATASELAAVTGLTPSAMSYHLRALARWDIVERADGGGDGRERPWQLAHTRMSFAGSGPGHAVADTLLGQYLGRLGRDLQGWLDREDGEPQAWRDAQAMHRGFPYLTAAELARVNAAVDTLLEELGTRDRTADDHPPDARRVATMWVAVPLGAPPAADATDDPADG